MARAVILLALLVAPAAEALILSRETAQSTANPVRKVVTLLQMMQKKVEAEGEKETDLYEKFMCYCKTGTGTLADSIASSGDKITTLSSDIAAAEANLAKTKEKLKADQEDRASAEKTLAEATAQREKEAKAFAAEKTESNANLDMVAKATAAIEAGMAGSFLQTGAAEALKKLVASVQDFSNDDKEVITSFLSGNSQYAPQSGQVTGILKTMHDEMAASLADATKAENAAIKEYKALSKAKNKEIKALTKAIEDGLNKVGELEVSIAAMKNDLGDTEQALIEDKKFLVDLKTNCATKTGEYEEHCKLRTGELLALADTIKILNDDDALDLFKKTLPAPSASSFVQMSTKNMLALQASARSAIKSVLAVANPRDRAGLDLISLALHGKKIGFDKVIKMIDEMVVTLKSEQNDDDSKKEYCGEQLDVSDDKKKSLERSVAQTETLIADTKESISTTKSEIATLKADIAALDKSVMDATMLRRQENEEYKSLMAENSAAKELLNIAKNRLNKYYNPKLYQPPAKEELSAMDRTFAANGGSSLSQQGVAPPPPPPTAAKEYSTKSGETSGVIKMIDMLIMDLDKDMTAATAAEKDSQADYETMMKDSAAKRADDSQTLTDKQGHRADLEAQLEKGTDDLKSFNGKLSDTNAYIAQLHAECDWLLKYFDVRQAARASEIDALGKAKAVLSGSDYSLLQTTADHGGFLARSA